MRNILLLLVGLGLVFAATSHAAKPMRFHAQLSGFNAAGAPVDTAATGHAMVEVIDDGTALEFKVTVAGIDNPAFRKFTARNWRIVAELEAVAGELPLFQRFRVHLLAEALHEIREEEVRRPPVPIGRDHVLERFSSEKLLEANLAFYQNCVDEFYRARRS